MRILKQGEKVFIEATALRVYSNDDTDIAYRSVDLQLPDGQLVQTNVRNLRPIEEEAKAVKDPAENKAIGAPAETKAGKQGRK